MLFPVISPGQVDDFVDARGRIGRIILMINVVIVGKRLFYVALTRAQFKLYVPFFPATSGHAWIGPVCRFLSAAIASAFPQAGDNPALGWQTAAAGAEAGLDEEGALEQKVVSRSAVEKFHPLLPPYENYQSRRIMLESFSSLQGRHYPGPEQQPPETEFQVVHQRDREDDERFAVFDSDIVESVRPDDEIPGGAEIGSMFHDIFEHIDFEAVDRNPGDLLADRKTKDVILKTMDAYRVDSRWRPQVCRMIADTLTSTVTTLEEPFALGQLRKEDRVHEVEFYYPIAFGVGEPLKIPDCDIVAGSRCFIRGFVDLVFRHKGKYFIADWKSNRLDDGYGHTALDACMNNAGYHMQYKLYTVATLRWLKQAIGDRFDADSQFGGVFYFFLRGMGSGNGNGVYFASPAEVGTLENLESEIAARIAGQAGQ